ncbi:hypothetical protein THAOC_13104 [Thalassiosira oceanica]|uniref:Reverse transcriptase Ty1/copia-type domain-containing protein n=1 Tax=Thalassiosira oceanica TaxID=159749 RepID=K0SYA8_THAOC|nr:hypothetical protein THAOC_13104 [Thalassiosira oceanica]|eukprot:EJK65996.1 hypothetical protein THAOC_13104 [Thalassiosira oceanica]
MYQDNQAAILLETNGKFSSSKRTKHIDNRYFQITDKIANGLLEVMYKHTDQMWADFFTKPLQGKRFREFRAKVMNCAIDYVETTTMDDPDHLKPNAFILTKITHNAMQGVAPYHGLTLQSMLRFTTCIKKTE